jgi:hypothetical protein
MSPNDKNEETPLDALTGGATPPPRVLMLNDELLERGLTPPPRIVALVPRGEEAGLTTPPKVPPPKKK